MKFIPLIISGLFANRLRTVFTIASVVASFMLFGLLESVDNAIYGPLDYAHIDRLYVRAKPSMRDQLPVAYGRELEQVPGVARVASAIWFGGYYQDPKNKVTSWAIDPESYFDIFTEYRIPKEQVAAMARLRTGGIIGAALARRYGFRVGDHVPFRSGNWTKKDESMDWGVDIVGIYTDPDDLDSESQLFVNHDYLDENRVVGKHEVSWYYVRVDNPKLVHDIASSIDKHFSNSSHETKTATERENFASFLRKVGDVTFMIHAVILGVFFSILFLIGNTMAQSIRDRIPEFAILMTLGYSGRVVMVLVLTEGLFLNLGAATVGLLGARILAPFVNIGGQAADHLPFSVFMAGLGYAAILAIVVGLPPALRASRLKIVDALDGR